MAEQLVMQPQQLFFQPPELEKTERQGNVVAEIAEITEVIRDPLLLQGDPPQRGRARRRLDAAGRLERHGVRPGVRDRRVTAHAAGEARSVRGAQRLEALLDPLVLVPAALLKPQHSPAYDAEAE